MAWDETGGGNAVYSYEYVNSFKLSAYIETAPLVDRYEEQGLVKRVDGNRPIDLVTESIVAAIQSRTEQSTVRVR